MKQENKLVMNKFRYCPYCGKLIQGSNSSQLNYCRFCGIKLNINNSNFPNLKIQCTICHDPINLEKSSSIQCSFCDSQYHTTCITPWLLKYNSCPMCLNVFIMPKHLVFSK